jgi:hypothetical protein
MSVANDFFLGNSLRDLESDDRSSQQANRFDYSLCGRLVPACGEGTPADAGSYYDEQQRSAGEQKRHERMNSREHPQNDFH